MENIYSNLPFMIPFSGLYVGYGPREYGIYRMSKPRKKLKGWQKELKRKNK